MRELRQHLPWDRHCAWCITYIKFRELRWFSQGHTAKQHQRLDVTPEATASSAKPLKKVQREPLAIKFLYLCQWNPSCLPHGRRSWWAWMSIHSLLVKTHSLCAYHATLDLRCVSTGVHLGWKTVSINFQTLPRNQSCKTQCTRCHHPGELSGFHQQDYPRSGPFKHFFRMYLQHPTWPSSCLRLQTRWSRACSCLPGRPSHKLFAPPEHSLFPTCARS